jgi:predicted anti-sigma-YlaC factor YlaD
MNCRKVSRWLSAYIEGDLWPTQVQRMDEHLRNCAACREKLVDIRMVVQVSGDLEKLEPGPYFTNRVLCTVGAQKQKTGLLYGWRPKLALSAASFTVAAIVTFMNMSPYVTNLPIADNQVGTKGTMVKASVLPGGNTGDQHGFPVSDDVLKRDMALVESLKSDSQFTDSVLLPQRFIQQVEQNR